MSQTKTIDGLQYLRGLAAIAVVVDHSAGMAALPKYFNVEILSGALLAGSLGVDIFFVVSGFIISIVALNSDFSPAIDRKTFFLKRFARIIPLMWLTIISYGLLRLYANPSLSMLGSYGRALFLLPWGDVDPNHIWTLRHEALFYIMFAMTMLRKNQMIWLLAAWFAAPLIIYPAAYLAGIEIERDSFFGVLFRLANIEFGLGFVIGLLFLKNIKLTWSMRLNPFIVMTVIAIACMAAGAASRDLIPNFGGRVIAALICAIPVVLGVGLVTKRGRLAEFGLLLGNASYAIYLFHSHFLSASLLVFSRTVPHAPVWLVVAAVAAIAVTIGVVLHLFVERPLVAFAQGLLLGKRVRPAPQQAPL